MVVPEAPPMSFLGRIKAQLVHMVAGPMSQSFFGTMNDAFKKHGIDNTLAVSLYRRYFNPSLL